MEDTLRHSTIAIVGGTGSEGQALAGRWARAGLTVILGSRDDSRAQQVAGLIAQSSSGNVTGMENARAVAAADVVILAVPFEGQIPILKSLKDHFQRDAVLITTVVPLATSVNDRATRLIGVWQGSAAEQAAEIVPSHVTIASAFHNLSASVLNADGPVDSDVIVCSDTERGRQVARDLAETIPGVRVINGGKLENSRIVEALTALLVGINIRYKVHSAGIRITGLETR